MERIWKDLYAAARAVLNPRRVSKMMEAESGKIYVGVCVDTACTLGVCAERNAIFNMITNGESGLRRVLAINSKGKALPPCGACRELMTQLMQDCEGTMNALQPVQRKIKKMYEDKRQKPDKKGPYRVVTTLMQLRTTPGLISNEKTCKTLRFTMNESGVDEQTVGAVLQTLAQRGA